MTDRGRSEHEPAPGTGPGLLPEPVRLRTLALAADAIGQIPSDQLPAPLRPLAGFARARRAKLAATPIASALEADETFRGRLATQVRAAVPELAAALDEGTPPPAANPVEVAAVAYLLRADGWQDLVAAARDSGEGNVRADETEPTATVERLQRKLHEARQQIRSAQSRAKQQVSDVKRENADLRRKLAEARQAVAAAEVAAREAETAREAAQKDTAALEAEARRLRSRISELEASSSAARRSARDEREAANNRARLLLDTLLASVQGLRRELALPPVSGQPADTVAEELAPDDTPGATGAGWAGMASAGMALSTDDPALLGELLTLPHVHLIVDGYNVTKTAWETVPLETQRTRLLRGLAPLVARSRTEVTVVFDGADLSERPPVGGPRGVRVMFSPPGVIADDVIRQLLEAEPQGRPVVVVSSDREVAADAVRAGARPVEASALVRMLAS